MDVLGPDRPVEPSDLNKFQYMDRVIRETMRIFPVGPTIVRAATEDIKLGIKLLRNRFIIRFYFYDR